jgi:hypothetical protein
MGRVHPVLLPLLLFVTLVVLQAANWSAPGDEGGTFDQAMGPVLLDSGASAPTPFRDVAPILDNDHDYGVSDVVQAMQKRGMHPPAYYVGIHSWTRVTGTSPPWLRLPGILLGLVTVLCIWGVTRELAPGGSAATWAALLMAVSVNHLTFSITLRPYALELALLTASLWLLLRLRAEGSPRQEATRWAGFVAVSVLGLYTLYHYVFVLAWQFGILLLWALWVPKNSRGSDLAKLVLAGLLVVVGFAPWLESLAGHLELTASRRFYFQGFPPAETWLINSANQIRKLILGEEFPSLGVLTPVAEIAFLTALLLTRSLLSSGPPERRRELRLFWLSVPLLPASIFLADFLRDTHTAFLLKTMLALLPLGIAALAVGASALSNRKVGTACLVLWLVIFSAASINRVARTVRQPGWQERVAEVVAARDESDHVVVVSSNDRRFLLPLLVTLRDTGVEHVGLALGPNGRLKEVLTPLMASGELEAISLVSFGDDEGWDDATRQDAWIVARMMGWRRVANGVPALFSLERTPASATGSPQAGR